MDIKILNKLLEGLNTPCKIIAFDEIDSTNNKAKIYARESADSMTLVIAEKQSAGRGRMGRSFFSSENNGIYFSLILRPELKNEDAFLITPAAAVAVSDVLYDRYNIDAKIKWVNDIYINDKKVCGILTESSFKPNGFLDWAVIGVGINYVAPTNGYPEEISNIAASVFENNAPQKELFASQIISSVISKCKNLPNDSFVSTYRMRSYLTGKTVTLPSGDEVKVTGIDNRCGLVIERSNGSIETITTSDVSVKISSKNSLI